MSDTGIDYAARRRRVRAAMRDRGVDLLALGPSENMTYLLGFHPHPDERPCLLLLSPESEGFLMPALNAEDSKRHTDVAMEVYADEEGPDGALGRLAGPLGFSSVRSVALDELMRTDFSLLLLSHVTGASPSLAAELVGELRMRKDAAEIERIQRNAACADAAMKAAYSAVRAGATELEVANAARRSFTANGVDQVNFTIVGAGSNGAFPHHHTGSTVLCEGDAVVIDIGARMGLYNSDLTRMAVVGEPSEDYLEVHRTVEAAVRAALAAIRPGVRARDIDEAARGVITEAGYGPHFVHRTGHGLGLTGHEPPYITATSDFVLEAGMVFSVEPGIYLQGRFGVRLEEIVTITETGVHIFSQLPRDLHVA
ncbi:MAG: M24 family metallopeptidase [Truepera sp.]|nr:M24 family metallopeptidase [Truepera sp.]